MTEADRAQVLVRAFSDAGEAIERVQIALDVHPLTVATLRTAISGTVICTQAVRDMVAQLIERSSDVLEDPAHAAARAEVLAELRALSGCLAIGAHRVEPVIHTLTTLAMDDATVAPSAPCSGAAPEITQRPEEQSETPGKHRGPIRHRAVPASR